MDGYTVGLLSWFALVLVAGLLVGLALLARQPRLARPQPAPAPPACGTPWPPSEHQLCGDWASACALADPDLPIGELRQLWLDYHARMGNVVVVPVEHRQVSSTFQPPAPGWRFGR